MVRSLYADRKKRERICFVNKLAPGLRRTNRDCMDRILNLCPFVSVGCVWVGGGAILGIKGVSGLTLSRLDTDSSCGSKRVEVSQAMCPG